MHFQAEAHLKYSKLSPLKLLSFTRALSLFPLLGTLSHSYYLLEAHGTEEGSPGYLQQPLIYTFCLYDSGAF